MHNAIPGIFLPLLVEVLEKGGVRVAWGVGMSLPPDCTQAWKMP